MTNKIHLGATNGAVCKSVPATCTDLESNVTCTLCLRQIAKDALAFKPKEWTPQNQVLQESRPTWPTWRAAFEQYFIFKDDGYPMKSTSDPNRFGSMHSGTTNADGDRAQGIAGDLAIVARLYEEAFSHPFILESGEPIEGYTASKIFEYRIAGRDRDLDGKKLARRVEWIAEDMIGTINALEMQQVQGVDVTRIVAHGVAHIEEGLHSRGLVSYRERGRN